MSDGIFTQKDKARLFEAFDRLVATGEEVLALIREISVQVKIANSAVLEQVLQQLFQADAHREIYLLSDGERSLRDLEKLTRVNYQAVRKLWKNWAALDIVEEAERQGRYRAKFDNLTDLAAWWIEHRPIVSQKIKTERTENDTEDETIR